MSFKWNPIGTAPTKRKEMFVVRAFDVPGVGTTPYTSDPYCVWRSLNGNFVRWPHPFPPTHWMKLPPKPESE